jgi:hypothetical protein
MYRIGLAALLGVLCTACMGFSAGLTGGDRSSATNLAFDTGATEVDEALLAFDPAQHSMNISITIEPLSQTADLDVLIVTDKGTRYLVLNSFHECREEGESRLCDRSLPVMPDERVGDWRVLATRSDASASASIDVTVDWVPLGS